MGIKFRHINSGLLTPLRKIATPALHVPCAAPTFANMMDEATPMNPKKGAIAGHESISMISYIYMSANRCSAVKYF